MTRWRNPNFKIKFFKILYDNISDGWEAGPNIWDSLIFTPSKDVRIYGAGVFESSGP